jgi:hypothetical protein
MPNTTDALLRECRDFLSVTIGGNVAKRQELVERITAVLSEPRAVPPAKTWPERKFCRHPECQGIPAPSSAGPKDDASEAFYLRGAVPPAPEGPKK